MRQRKSKKVSGGDRLTVGYVRVSTDDQAERGVSLAAQSERIAAYATALGWGDLEVVRDAGESAKSLQRPGIAALLDCVRLGTVARIVVTKLDRLTRSTRDLADLLDLCTKHDVALVSIAEHLDTSSAAGRMVTNMLGVVAQWEREAIGERTATALAHKRSRREVYGSTPFGFRREGDRLVEVRAEQEALREAVRLDRDGASFRAIGRMLAERGIAPRRGREWYASSVSAMLRSRIVGETFPAA